VEDRYRKVLRDTRARDRAAGRTLRGPHLSDLRVVHGPKDLPAERASTGEQKALLTGLVLAHVSLVSRLVGIAPLMLLDEVGAHLDPARRSALFDRFQEGSSQVWLTGADPLAFEALAGRAATHEVTPGRVERRRGA
jgi:DNA replication and repair protein RecF